MIAAHPVEVMGETWPSFGSLARYLGIGKKTVAGWVHAGRQDLLIAAVRARRRGCCPSMNKRSNVYSWKGRHYTGMSAIASAAKRDRRTIVHHLRVHGNLDRLGVGRGCHDNHQRKNQKPVSIMGRSWPSRAALAKYTGLPRKAVSKWVAEGQLDRIIIALMAADASVANEAMRHSHKEMAA